MRPLRSLPMAAAVLGLAMAQAIGAQARVLQFVTRHTGMIGGHQIGYTATVEQFIENSAAGKPALSLIVTSYVREGVSDAAKRPVIFLFNGGPSGSSSGLHMQLGPLQPRTSSATSNQSPAFIGNPDSLLDAADLVFFDPAETGFSRVLPGGKRSHYYSLDRDAESLAELVVAWVHRHGRERSPRYLLGESYGSIRAVVAAQMLSHRLPVNGVILFGNSLPIRETSGGVVGAATSLPMEAMAAAYHGKVQMHGLAAPALLDRVYAFATDEYLPALAEGDALPAGRAEQIADRLSAYTAIPARYYLAHHLVAPRPLASDTRKLSTGALDPSVPAPPAPRVARLGKPSAEERSVVGEYMRTQLGVELPGLRYREMAPDSFKTWDYGSGCDGWMRAKQLCYLWQRTVFSDYDWPAMLAHLFAQQPRFRAMIVAGYYDGLSSIGQTRYMLAHHDYPSSRLVYREYASGHATAADPKARRTVVSDIRVFLRTARG